MFKNDKIESKWIELKKLRDICNISIESKRANKEIGSSLEANLIIKISEQKREILENVDLAELCITSNVIVEFSNDEKISCVAKKAEGNKCPICWKVNLHSCKRHS